MARVCLKQMHGPDHFSRSSALASTIVENMRRFYKNEKKKSRKTAKPNLMVFYDGTIQTMTLPTYLSCDALDDIQ